MTDEPPSPDTTGAAPPRAVVWVALAVCVVGTVMLLLGAWRAGVSTDEPAHVLRYGNLQQHGWYLLDDDFDGDQPGAWVTDQYVYAPVFSQLTHAVNRWVGLDPPDGLGTSVRAYAVRHLLVGVCGLTGTIAVAAIGRRLLGSWTWGLVSAGTLMAIPMWPGLSMFDVKDVPAATGYTLVTAGLVELLFTRRPGARQWWSPVTLLVAGLVLAIGTRPGLWPALVASMAVVGLLPWSPPGRPRESWQGLLVPIAAAVAGAYALLLLAYPAFFARPQEWFADSLGESAHYTGSAQLTSAGSWAYLPANVVAVVMPPVLLLVGVLGCLTLVPRRLPAVTPELCGWLAVALQALLLPVLAVVRQSHLSDHLRQVLFACPAVALLLTLGWRRFVTELGKDSRHARGVLGLVWSAALVGPVVVQLQLFPYGYSYAAPQASSLGALVQDDYARLSFRELLPQIPRGEFVVCSPSLSDQGDTMRYSADCRTDPLSSFSVYRVADSETDGRVVDDTFLALFTRGMKPGRNCQELGTVERWRYFSRAVMSRVARCRLVLNPYPDSGVAFGQEDSRGAEFLLGAWTSHPTVEGVRLSGPTGSLGFELPVEWSSVDLRVRLEGEALGVPHVWVNNEPVTAARVGPAWVVDVPASTVAAMGERRLVVTLSPATPDQELVLAAAHLAPL